MSLRIIRKVLAHGPDEARLRYLLVAIANHANDQGDAWPGIERLATMTCSEPRTTRRRLRQLEKEGWVAVTRHPGRGNRYRIDIDRLRPGAGDPPVPGAGDPPGALVPPVPQTEDSSTPTPGVPVPSHPGYQCPPNVVGTKFEQPRSGVSPPPNGRQPTLTPEQTRAHADAIRRTLRQQGRGPP